MRVHTVVLLAALSMAIFATSAQAHRGGPPGLFGGGPGGGFGGPGLMIEHMADHLDLDDVQREQIQNIVEAASPEFESLREQLRANREALESLATDDPAYSTQLNDIAVSNGELATEGTLLFTRVRGEVQAILTEEQLEKLKRGKERMRQAFEPRGKHR